ncbi:nucleotidyltransferase domain-containing protein [Candidatus Pacearchaeota archaeon]|nr:nucleotidyltransferase domain-containing protein [Candidatus Pacearchaeota archaeon]
MLKKINSLSPFIEDCYKELGVREYSRIIKITAPTASKILKEFESEGLLKKREERRFLLFRANRDNIILKDISKIYWRQKLNKLIDYVDSELYPSKIILFGSLTKLEVRENSDIDLAILTKIKKRLNLEKYEKLYKRKIQVFYFTSMDKINKELRNNLLNGYLIKGEFE